MNVRPDELSFLNSLNPRRVEVPIARLRIYLPGIGTDIERAVGLRTFVLIFPKESAVKLGEFLAKHPLPSSLNAQSGSRDIQNEDHLEFASPTYEGYDEYLEIRAAPGERMLTVVRNVDPRH